jgi:hypothetical protein
VAGVIAKPGLRASNDYILTAVSAPTAGSRVRIYRTLVNVPQPTYVDAVYDYNFTAPYTPIVKPSGTVQLAEYWHQKPFTVKEMFVEYSVGTEGIIYGYVEPTGVVDVPVSNLPNVVATQFSDAGQTSGGFRMYRYWPDNASKGFGMKPHLTLTNCTVKRVIVNCED